MTFAEFDLLPQSLKALNAQGITEPTPIQTQSIPPLLESKDVIGQARTGSGKTLAFSIPMVEFIEPDNKAIQAVVITPTRELANQITDVVNSLGAEDGLKVLPVYGGRSINPQITALKRGGIHILVATPGRLVDLIRRKAVHLDKVVYAVVDEADEMLDSGFAKDVEFILKSIKQEHVTALFSATMPDWVHEASRKYLHEPVIVNVMPEKRDAPKIEHTVLNFPADYRMDVLRSLLDGSEDGTAIVFGRTKHGVKKLAKRLEDMGYSVGCLQGNMSQNARDRVMKDFRESEIEILVATNVAARGLDVDHVELVVNYELPENAELLTHRIGRTGRMGREGFAYTLVADNDSKKWNMLKKAMTNRLPEKAWKAEGPPKNEVGKTASKPKTGSASSRRSSRPSGNGQSSSGRSKAPRSNSSKSSSGYRGSRAGAGRKSTNSSRRRPSN